jgi:hypothetical protein
MERVSIDSPSSDKREGFESGQRLVHPLER